MTHEWKVAVTIAWHDAWVESSRELTVTWHDVWVESSRELTVATEKHVLPPQVHMNVITCPTPPHPCIHAPTGSQRQACPSSASSHWTLLHATPHPTPPMCTKHHGLLKAVVQLTIYLSIYLYKYIYIYIHTVHACMSWVWANNHISSNIHINIHKSIWHVVAQFKAQRSLWASLPHLGVPTQPEARPRNGRNGNWDLNSGPSSGMPESHAGTLAGDDLG